MVREIQRRVLELALVLAIAPSGELQAQEHQRFQVLIPDLRPQATANRRFGENVARELRLLVEEMATHQAVSEGDMEKGMREFKVGASDLDCDATRHLASQMGSQLALCAGYAEQASGFTVSAEFFDVRSSESFRVSPMTVPVGGEADAARHIFEEFDLYTQQLRSAAMCAEYVSYEIWDQALESCERSIALNPGAVASRFARARVLFATQRFPEALDELGKVLEANPVHQDALQLAGYLASREGQDEAAFGFYSRYLELNPGDAAVRKKIAYDLAQQGDATGAMVLIQKGVDHDPTNIDLWEQLGGYAFAAGQHLNSRTRTEAEDATGVLPDAVTYFRTAIEAYSRVFEARGPETPAAELRSVISAYLLLNEKERALSMAERAIETHPGEANLWYLYADALQRSGRVEEALGALDHLAGIDPAFPGAGLRRGTWLLELGRLAEAAAALKSTVAGDPTQADAAGRLVVAHAYARGVQPKRWDLALQAFSAAQGIPGISTEITHQINFWMGYAIFQGTIPEQEARTLATAQASLPKFQRAKGLLGQVGDYPRQVNVNLAEILQAVNQYIEIQEIIIRRGR